MSRQEMTLEQMHQNIARMKVLEQRDSFTDDDMHEISELFEGFWRVPGTDELDTPKTTDSGVEEDGTSWAIGEGLLRNRNKYEKAKIQLYDCIQKVGQELNFEWFYFIKYHPRSETEPGIYGDEYVKKIYCCLCNLTKYADKYGQLEVQLAVN
jgi:hypothetical protein